ncbi:IS481 family transposase [SAR202 cluster bacterium AD-812-D07_MRT_10900m]|nr:IS481 family transposase [SAR202 cluster bacterium AD-812-D07_MRT_10900m]
MSHLNSRLTIRARLEMVQQVESGWSQAEVARQFRVSRATVSKYVCRYRTQGKSGLVDRSSRPLDSPRLTQPRLVRAICKLRRKRSWGPHRIGWELKISRSTIYAVLKRAGLNRLAWMHRTTREIIRYEHASPGDMLHLDVKKLGRVPDGGGKRFAPGFAETQSEPKSKRSLGIDYMHVAIDDNSRVAYVEALPDEKGVTTAEFLERALGFYRSKGVIVKRILTDNGGNYRSHAFADVARNHAIRLKRTRPYRPQTNGKAERFIRTLQQEWAYSRPFKSNQERLKELKRFINYYNLRRPHGGIDGAVPASRL